MLLSAKYALPNKAPSRKTEQAILSSGLGRTRTSAVSLVSASWLKLPLPKKLQNLPVGHSDRIMSLRLPIQDNKFATVLSVYAPTLQAETGVKEAFYRDLHNLLQQNDSKDKLLILGDFNARVGREFEP